MRFERQSPPHPFTDNPERLGHLLDDIQIHADNATDQITNDGSLMLPQTIQNQRGCRWPAEMPILPQTFRELSPLKTGEPVTIQTALQYRSGQGLMRIMFSAQDTPVPDASSRNLKVQYPFDLFDPEAEPKNLADPSEQDDWHSPEESDMLAIMDRIFQDNPNDKAAVSNAFPMYNRFSASMLTQHEYHGAAEAFSRQVTGKWLSANFVLGQAEKGTDMLALTVVITDRNNPQGKPCVTSLELSRTIDPEVCPPEMRGRITQRLMVARRASGLIASVHRKSDFTFPNGSVYRPRQKEKGLPEAFTRPLYPSSLRLSFFRNIILRPITYQNFYGGIRET